MYDDEYFDCVMNAPPVLNTKPDEHRKPLIYKYFSDLPQEVHQLYFTQYSELQNASDRRTLLGSSLNML